MARTNRTREDWLNQFARLTRPHFKQLTELDYEKVRVATGYITRSVMGRTFIPQVSTTGHHEIQVCYAEDNRIRIAGTLIHELIHAAGIANHGNAFKTAGLQLGLTGKPTAMGWDQQKTIRQVPAWARPIFKACGPYPKGHIDLSLVAGKPKPGLADQPGKPGKPQAIPTVGGPKPQIARMMKAKCTVCGLVFRIAGTWITKATIRDDGTTKLMICPDTDCTGCAITEHDTTPARCRATQELPLISR